jgi:hypothetical protein
MRSFEEGWSRTLGDFTQAIVIFSRVADGPRSHRVKNAVPASVFSAELSATVPAATGTPVAL